MNIRIFGKRLSSYGVLHLAIFLFVMVAYGVWMHLTRHSVSALDTNSYKIGYLLGSSFTAACMVSFLLVIMMALFGFGRDCKNRIKDGRRR